MLAVLHGVLGVLHGVPTTNASQSWSLLSRLWLERGFLVTGQHQWTASPTLDLRHAPKSPKVIISIPSPFGPRAKDQSSQLHRRQVGPRFEPVPHVPTGPLVRSTHGPNQTSDTREFRQEASRSWPEPQDGMPLTLSAPARKPWALKAGGSLLPLGPRPRCPFPALCPAGSLPTRSLWAGGRGASAPPATPNTTHHP